MFRPCLRDSSGVFTKLVHKASTRLTVRTKSFFLFREKLLGLSEITKTRLEG